MSSLLRRLPLSRLLLLCTTVVAVAVLCTALASALGGDPKPAPKPLAQAVHDALSAPKPQGFSAHVKLVNHLIEGASLQGQEGNGGSSPLLGDAEGRVWISADGHIRLELQSERGATQILYDGSTLTIYEASSNTLYEYTPPAQKTESGQHAPSGQPPSVAEIQNAITHLMGHVDLSGAQPTDIAGQPAYSVRISPHSNGGLIGGAELAFDAGHGVPLQLAIYAKGDTTPVLALTATEVSYGPVAPSVFSLSLPTGVKKTQIGPPNDSASVDRGSHPHIDAQTTGLAAVQAKLPFALQAPASLAGMSRNQVRLIEVNGHDSALLSYGEGLGGILVVESQGKQGAASESDGASQPGLPQVSIDGAKASELPTALGTLLGFQSNGVDHILLGSVTPSVIQAAARGL
jgi:outer membrane lipoprotein-sorting protein